MNSNGLYILKDGKSEDYTFDDGNTILCGVPGAFTPGCTNRHLPGFANNMDKLKGYKVVFMAVNDSYVMNEWNKLYGHPDIESVSDPLAIFSKGIGEDIDYGETFGIRWHRFALLIQDGEIVKKFKDPFIDGVLSEIC